MLLAAASYDLWADLLWGPELTGLEPYPSGILKVEFPYTSDGVTVWVEADVSFDGSQVVLVEIRVGYWRTSFYLNLATGEVSIP